MTLKTLGSNMTQLTVGGATVFFSYSTPVAACVNGKYFRTDKKWSNTTSRHINTWLGGSPAEVKSQTYFDNLVK